MKNIWKALALVGAFLSPALTQASSNPLQEYTISAENITAKFIGYGARLTSLVVPARGNTNTEIAVGYDDPAKYVKDTATNHTYFGECCQSGRFQS
jgi:aldose 1-epimerase